MLRYSNGVKNMTAIKKFGTSLGVILDKTVIQKVYHLEAGSEVNIEYKFDAIIIKPAEVDKK